MSLRDGAIYAIANVLAVNDMQHGPPDMLAELTEDMRAPYLMLGSDQVDALLDYLETHADEWEEMVHVRRRVWAAEAWAARDPDHEGFESFAVSLIAALRLVDQEPAD